MIPAVCGVLLPAVGLVAAPPPVPDDLSARLSAAMKDAGPPALGAIVVNTEGVLAHGAAGLRAKGDLTKVTLDDRWHVGSCTKSMTATLCARLVERGVLSWDRTLAEAFPELKDQMHESFRAVTLRQLLSHRAGIQGEPPPKLWGALWKHKGTSTEGRELTAQDILTRAPNGTPGEHFEYSNFGYMIAGLMAERATGKAWEDLMRDEVFTPLNMTSAGFGPPGTADKLDNARGHGPGGEPIQPGRMADNPPSLGPAGTVHATLADMGEYARAHLRGARGEQTSFLKPGSFATLHSPTEGDYALGWVLQKPKWAQGHSIFWHNGSNTMWYAEMAIVPEANVAVVVTVNDALAPSQKTVRDTLHALVREFANPALNPPAAPDQPPGAK